MRERETLAVFFSFFVLNVLSMAPSVTFGDAGELTAAAATLSVAHSPGYPLHALLGKALGTLLPWGNWALRTNLLTAAAMAGALALLCSAMRCAGFSLLARVGAVLFLGLSGLWRHESAVTEVFGLQVLTLCFLVWVVCRYRGTLWGARPMAAGGLGFGLGLANHHTLVLALPAILWQALHEKVTAPVVRKGLLVAAAFTVLGMGCYLFLPIRSQADPPLDWGNPTNASRFLRVLLRKDYGSFALTVEGQSGEVSRLSQIPRYLVFTARELGPVAAALALLGLAAWRRLGLGLHAGFPVTLLVFTGPFFLFLGNPPYDPMTSYALERFYLSSWVGGALLIAAGLDLVVSFSPWAGRALLLVPVLSLGLGWGASSMRWDLTSYDYGRNILKTLPRGSALFMDGGDDTFYSLAFLSYAERMRPDLSLHDRGGLVFRSAYGPDFRALPKDLKEKRRVEVEAPLAASGGLYYSTVKDEILPGYRHEPVGVLRRPLPAASRDAVPDAWPFYALRFSPELLARHYRHRALIAFYPYMRAAWLLSRGMLDDALLEVSRAMEMGADALWLKPAAVHLVELAAFHAYQKADWPRAEAAYRYASSLDPETAGHLVNLGAIYHKQGEYEKAIEVLQRLLASHPDTLQAWRNLGTVYWATSRWKEAAKAFARARALAPDDPELERFEALCRKRAGL